MKKRIWKTGTRWIMAALALTLVLTSALPAAAWSPSEEDQLYAMGARLCQNVADPGVSQTGGDWAVLSLARAGIPVPEGYLENYYRNVEDLVRARAGVLSATKNTEYSRVILALTAIGKDPRNVAGYDLTRPLANYEQTIRQGVNGAIFALIALNSGGYDIPSDPSVSIPATRERYRDYILSAQQGDGGFGLSSSSDTSVDLTAMAVQALAGCEPTAAVRSALQKALIYLSRQQTGEGGYADYGELNAESTAQVIIALREAEDFWGTDLFPAGTEGMLDSLMGFALFRQGFSHLRDPLQADQLATEQGLLALTAEYRRAWHMDSLYNMKRGWIPAFRDTAADPNRGKIRSLAERGIINGKAAGVFDPSATMTRAEFAAIVVRGMGLALRREPIFEDVSAGDWFYGYAAAAYRAGIVKGVSETRFDPQGTITRQEALTMVARVAAQKGLVLPDAPATEAVLSRLADGDQISSWAREASALCLSEGLTEAVNGRLVPAERVKRSEIAGIIYNLCTASSEER